MSYITDILTSQYPYDEPYIRTGCLLRFKTGIIFHFPFGAFVSMLTRKVIENLMQPIYCNTKSMEYKKGIANHKGFNRKACWRLRFNRWTIKVPWWDECFRSDDVYLFYEFSLYQSRGMDQRYRLLFRIRSSIGILFWFLLYCCTRSCMVQSISRNG
jgi:hypothetical protein